MAVFSLKPPKNPDSNSQMMQLVRASRPCKLQSKLSMMMMPVSLLPPSMLALAKPTIKIFTAQRNLWSPFPRFPVATFPLTGIVSSRKSFSIQFPAQESNTHKKKRVFPPGPFIGARGGSSASTSAPMQHCCTRQTASLQTRAPLPDY